MFKILIGIVLLTFISSYAVARPDNDSLTICYTVKNNEKARSFPCVVTESGGAGMSILVYKFNNKEYEIMDDGDSATINDEKFTGYMRDSFFKITKKASENRYYCYKSKSTHFCSAQPESK